MTQEAKQPNGRRRGFTLLEVIVATATAAVLFGIALAILLSTNQTANRTMGHESVLQQAQLAMRQVRSVIEATVWPEDLATAPPAGAFVFTKDTLTLLSSHEPTPAGQFCLYTLANTKQSLGQKEGARTVAGYERLEPATQKPIGAFQPFGKEFETSIAFRYATQLGPDLQPVWQESLPAGQKPRLIWVELIMRNADIHDHLGRPEEVRLETAVSL